MNHSGLSERGNILASRPARVDMELFSDAAGNLYDPETNPGGAFPLNVAENHVMTGIIRKKLEEITSGIPIPDWVLQYTDPSGHPGVREIMARFMETFLCRCPVDPDSIAFSAGAAGVIEPSSFILAEKEDVAVIPAPAYPVYTGDIGIKSGLERYDLQTHFHIEETGSTAPLTVAHLEKAGEDIKRQEKRFRLLIITSPDNPTGCVYGKEQLYELALWCIRNDVHMIVNEIYALSRIDTSDPLISMDYKEKIEFHSFARIMRDLGSGNLHLWYGLSKDFAMSGLRFGMVHSLNTAFMAAMRNVNIPHMVSNHTQWMAGELLRDHDFVSDYILKNVDQVTAGYKIAVRTLKRLGVPYVPARGSLFVWADLSKYLSQDSDRGQEELWTGIYADTGVLLTPGAGFGHTKKGLFRIVHTAVPPAHLRVAMERLETYLRRF